MTTGRGSIEHLPSGRFSARMPDTTPTPLEGVEVEFVTANGHTQALLTLRASQVRKVGPRDIVAVRPVQPAA